MPREDAMTECRVDGCPREANVPGTARGLCGKHYRRLRDHGSAMYEPPTPADRFWAKVDVGHPLGCWEWTAALQGPGTQGRGYGAFWVEGRQVVAHRWSYESLMGPIPPGLHLDHLCRNPPCVNPDHLEPVTNAENIRRGVAGDVTSRRCRSLTHCKRGHEFTEDNTYRRAQGRVCRKCQALANRAYRRRLKAKAASNG